MGIIVQGGHGFRGHEAGALDRPFVVLLQQDRADKAASALSWAQAAAMKAETTRRPLARVHVPPLQVAPILQEGPLGPFDLRFALTAGTGEAVAMAIGQRR
jgi:hypothetical protein